MQHYCCIVLERCFQSWFKHSKRIKGLWWMEETKQMPCFCFVKRRKITEGHIPIKYNWKMHTKIMEYIRITESNNKWRAVPSLPSHCWYTCTQVSPILPPQIQVASGRVCHFKIRPLSEKTKIKNPSVLTKPWHFCLCNSWALLAVSQYNWPC